MSEESKVTQSEIILRCLISAGKGITLAEISQVTGFGEASISAQIRHLRKPSHGSNVIWKRRREASKDSLGVLVQPYEYEFVPKVPFGTIGVTNTDPTDDKVLASVAY